MGVASTILVTVSISGIPRGRCQAPESAFLHFDLCISMGNSPVGVAADIFVRILGRITQWAWPSSWAGPPSSWSL